MKLQDMTCGELLHAVQNPGDNPIGCVKKMLKWLTENDVPTWTSAMQAFYNRNASEWQNAYRTFIAASRIPELKVEIGGADQVRKTHKWRISEKAKDFLRSQGMEVHQFEGHTCVVKKKVP